MSNTQVSENLSLEKFAEVYIAEALELAQQRGITLSEFDKQLKDRVTKRTGIPREVLKTMHHPFHWALFCDSYKENKATYRSPLELRTDRKMGMYLKPRCDISNGIADELTKKVLSEHGDRLRSQLRLYQQDS